MSTSGIGSFSNSTLQQALANALQSSGSGRGLTRRGADLSLYENLWLHPK
jgi:hypothetical protein